MCMELNDILKIAVKASASDIHLKAGLAPIFRIDGSLVPLNNAPAMTTEYILKVLGLMMNAQQRMRFEEFSEVDLAYGVAGVGRFRVNGFQQRGTPGLVFRVIPYVVKNFDQLDLPQVLKKIAVAERGLILVTGATGSGKSTTLAAMVDYINETQACNIVTIEEPIEYLIKDKRSLVNQREVGVDTVGFNLALRSSLRQDPDVILVGEMRDAETMETALQAAETGHLVLSTLHTSDAVETISRIVSVFPPYQHKQIRLQLASSIKAVVSQRLVAKKSGEGRVPAVEILINNTRIRELIENADRTKEVYQAIADGYISYGMQTFDQSLMHLLSKELISYEEALKQSSNPHDFALRASGIHSGTDTTWDAFESMGEGNLIPTADETERAADKK